MAEHLETLWVAASEDGKVVPLRMVPGEEYEFTIPSGAVVKMSARTCYEPWPAERVPVVSGG